ncbi:SgrR family transcriptional regulator [Paenibacillus sp. HB172176]|uniref:SgrR family transcriptional regulator n=1 Tax=Paenibacillus sp. HB172176 TaxID=2493690 RepID=UPI00143AA9C2|nr:SgrR family transcriptional regulator [Paenibacillus sp. HB172176]
MLSDERYLALYTRFAEGEGIDLPIEVTLEQLAEALYCTQRNVKLILRKLAEEGDIHWQAGLGRGNRSRLTFLVAKEKKLLDMAQQHALKGEYQSAFELIGRYGEGTSARQHFVEWMNGQFGYRTVNINDMEADVLRLPVYRPILTLDPKEIYYAFSAHMVKQIFDGLVQYDRETQRVVPSLAHAWEVNDTGMEWSFHLRRGVLFHHGRELEAEDVLYTFERLRGSAASGWFVRLVDRVEKHGARTVVFRLKQPNWLFLRFFCSSGLAIVPHELVEQDEHFWSHPIGTGPFRFVEWSQNQFVMEANPHYFQGRAHLDGVVIVMMPEDTAIYSKTWEQLLVDHDMKEFSLEQGWQKIEYVCKGCSLLTWNLGKSGPQQSAAFRKAVDLLIDRARMIKELGEDRIFPARGFYPDQRSRNYEADRDVESALALLAESGYNGEPVKIITYGIHEHDARWLQRELAVYGIVIELNIETWLTIRELEAVRSSDCILYCVVFAEDEVCMIELFEQSGNFLREHLDPGLLGWVKERIGTALGCKGEEDRWRYLMEIENKLRDECHVSFLLHKKLNTFYNPNIRGVGMNSLGWIDFKDIWLEAKT